MKRRYPNQPVVAVGAVVVKVGRVLLARRGKAPGYGRWSLPGGAVMLGEGLKEAVVREVREECGLDIEVGDEAEVVERIVRDEKGGLQYHYVIIDYLASWKGGELNTSSDVLEARWVLPEDFPLYNLTDGTIEVIRRLLKKASPKP